jgi:hypothetical protein
VRQDGDQGATDSGEEVYNAVSVLEGAADTTADCAEDPAISARDCAGDEADPGISAEESIPSAAPDKIHEAAICADAVPEIHEEEVEKTLEQLIEKASRLAIPKDVATIANDSQKTNYKVPQDDDDEGGPSERQRVRRCGDIGHEVKLKSDKIGDDMEVGGRRR